MSRSAKNLREIAAFHPGEHTAKELNRIADHMEKLERQLRIARIARKALKRLETNLNHAQPHPGVVITNMHAVVVEALKSMRQARRKQ